MFIVSFFPYVEWELESGMGRQKGQLSFSVDNTFILFSESRIIGLNLVKYVRFGLF